ncbi:hypothetical protein Enr13x_19140 [Stieleria neptunia]|uniref:NapA signal peptide-binding chaperone NapD n=1 Tax=Stieleria neptunia TaxID=2527979 RepID=A0A518HMI8_9BACT|nr:hypothetical protein [Stieleria neptunia]QDV42071.1 hypothetical protein Enr13x_19140 [Stieleria neptunia]
MPISGLVITFDQTFDDVGETIAMLRSEPTIEIGARDEQQCAIVVDTPSKADDKKIYQWVQDLPGVASIQIAFVGFDDEAIADSSSTTDSAD